MEDPVLPNSRLELSVSCADLRNMDMFSYSDPMCVAYMKNGGVKSEDWTEIGRTEAITDTLNPRWQKKFVINYTFEVRQYIKFEIYDIDSNAPDLSRHDFIGQCETTVGQIVSSRGGVFTSSLLTKDGSASDLGMISIVSEELGSSKEEISILFSASDFPSMVSWIWGSKADIFYEISKKSVRSSKKVEEYVLVYRSPVAPRTVNPHWAEHKLRGSSLINGNAERRMRISFFQYRSSGSHELVGDVFTSVDELRSLSNSGEKLLIRKATKSSGQGRQVGRLQVEKFDITVRPTFLDYVSSGQIQLNFSVAIDFTASNGHQKNPNSLHFTGNKAGQIAENAYTAAIKSVGPIIEDYDSDRKFPGLGFGARLPPDGKVSHEFALNLSMDNPFCEGTDGLLAAYVHCLDQITLFGPTCFAPVIRHVGRFAKAYSNGSHYFVLLIITDGVITDIDDTIDAIVNCSTLPMSIIIIGVGAEDFSAMHTLDADTRPLEDSDGRVASRDIVQFVELRNFQMLKTANYGNQVWDKAALSAAVLQELPDQVVGWMQDRHKYPSLSSL